MAAWGLDVALSVFDRDAIASLAHVCEGERVAVALAESVPTAPLRSIVLPLLQGARSVRVRAPRAQRAVASLWSAVLADEGLACQWDDEDGDRWLERVLKIGVATVVAFGSDARVERVRAELSVAGARVGADDGGDRRGDAPDDRAARRRWFPCISRENRRSWRDAASARRSTAKRTREARVGREVDARGTLLRRGSPVPRRRVAP